MVYPLQICLFCDGNRSQTRLRIFPQMTKKTAARNEGCWLCSLCVGKHLVIWRVGCEALDLGFKEDTELSEVLDKSPKNPGGDSVIWWQLTLPAPEATNYLLKNKTQVSCAVSFFYPQWRITQNESTYNRPSCAEPKNTTLLAQEAGFFCFFLITHTHSWNNVSASFLFRNFTSWRLPFLLPWLVWSRRVLEFFSRAFVKPVENQPRKDPQLLARL